MQHQKIPNPYSDDVPIGLGIFKGKTILLSLLGCGLIMMVVFQVSARMGVDFPFAVFVAALPFIALASYVVLFVLGRPASYSKDIFKTARFHIAQSMYLGGWIDRPPVLWKKRRAPIKP